MNKYRIKVEELNNGSRIYYPQKKKRLGWDYFYYEYDLAFALPVRFDNMTEALDVLKEYDDELIKKTLTININL